MLSGDAVIERNAALAALIGKRMHVRGKGLEAKFRQAKRSMPKWVQKEVTRMIEAETLLSHPRMMMQMDPTGLEQAYKRTEKWVRTIDNSERRKNFWLNLAAGNAFNLLVVILLAVVLLQVGGHL